MMFEQALVTILEGAPLFLFVVISAICGLLLSIFLKVRQESAYKKSYVERHGELPNYMEVRHGITDEHDYWGFFLASAMVSVFTGYQLTVTLLQNSPITAYLILASGVFCCSIFFAFKNILRVRDLRKGYW